MFTRHVSRQLAAQIDGERSPQEAADIERHLAQCAKCQTEREQVQFGMDALDHMELVEPPEAVWQAIEAIRLKGGCSQDWLPHKMAFAVSVVLVLAGAVYWLSARHPGVQWQVTRPDGSHFAIGAGEWIETDSKSSATVKVGKIGSVEVEPNTRLRVVTARAGEHRLAIARGEIRAKISAPPKLFFVDTASGTAVDLGCEYTLDAHEDGSGLLRVTKGWVSFQWHGLESLVPAGASCRIHPGAGPGLPYFDDASENLKQAVDQFAVNSILAEARVRDTLTLWHLLHRAPIEDRARVYDRIASLTPVPAGVTRELALKLDPQTLTRWKDELAWTW